MSENNTLEINLTLYPKQFEFVQDETRAAAFIGGIGTGKTRAGCVKAFRKMLANPGSYGVITAPTFPMLRDATKRTFFELVPPELVAYRVDNENMAGINCPGGGVAHVLFRSTYDEEALRGPNLTWAFMDEAALSSKMAYQIVLGRLRAGDPKSQQLFLTTTPKGLNWIYELFGPSRKDVDKFHAYYASTRDNPFLPEEYLHDVYGQYSGAFAEQELEGKFVPYEGLIYGDLLKYDLHIGDFGYNPDLPVDLTWDFGYPNPEAVLAIQQDERGQIYIVDELYRYQTLTEVIVAEAKGKAWFGNVHDCIADEARPDQILRLSNLGIPARASVKGKILDGIAKVRSTFQLDRTTKEPILHINRKCEGLIKELSLYKWADKKTQEDEWIERPIDNFNHALDAFRYWVVTKYNPASQVVPQNKTVKKRRVMGYQLLDNYSYKNDNYISRRLV